MNDFKEEMRFKSYLVREKIKPITYANQLSREEAKVLLGVIQIEAIKYFTPYLHFMVNDALGLPVDLGYGNLRDDFKEFKEDITLIRQALICGI